MDVHTRRTITPQLVIRVCYQAHDNLTRTSFNYRSRVITARFTTSGRGSTERSRCLSRPPAEACCLGQTLGASQVSSQHSWPEQMALNVNCFNCVFGFFLVVCLFCQSKNRETPDGTSVFVLSDRKHKPYKDGEERTVYTRIIKNKIYLEIKFLFNKYFSKHMKIRFLLLKLF